MGWTTWGLIYLEIFRVTSLSVGSPGLGEHLTNVVIGICLLSRLGALEAFMGGSSVLSGVNIIPCGIFQPPGLEKGRVLTGALDWTLGFELNISLGKRILSLDQLSACLCLCVTTWYLKIKLLDSLPCAHQKADELFSRIASRSLILVDPEMPKQQFKTWKTQGFFFSLFFFLFYFVLPIT